MQLSSGNGNGLSRGISMARKPKPKDLNSELRENLMDRAADFYCSGKSAEQIAALINMPTAEIKDWITGNEWEVLIKERRLSAIAHAQAMLPNLRARAAATLMKLLEEVEGKEPLLQPHIRAATALKILYTYQSSIESPDATPKLPDFTPEELRDNINQIYGIYPSEESPEDSDGGIPRVLRSAEVDDVSD
jgi:hypothetical protein